jgi:hypothetical protein
LAGRFARDLVDLRVDGAFFVAIVSLLCFSGASLRSRTLAAGKARGQDAAGAPGVPRYDFGFSRPTGVMAVIDGHSLTLGTQVIRDENRLGLGCFLQCQLLMRELKENSLSYLSRAE